MTTRLLASLAALLSLASVFTTTSPAFAHAFGQSFTLPIPVWIFLYGGAAAVALSFIVIGIFVGNDSGLLKSREKNLSKISFFKLVTGKTSRDILRFLSLFFFLLTIAAGLFGTADASSNIAPTLFWIVFLLGFTYLTAIFGDLWSVVNPWRTILDLWGSLSGEKITGMWRYPKSWGYLPALILYYLLIWNELLSGGTAAQPQNLARLLLDYSVITFAGAAIFGAKDWFNYGEFLSVFFKLVSKISPFTIREGKLRLRPPFIGLLEEKLTSFSLLIFILFMLSSTAFDGFRSTSTWFRLDLNIFPIYDTLGPNGYQIFQSVALLASPLIFLAIYLLLITVMKVVTGSKHSIRELALLFGFSLIPIAVVYNIAHYFTLLLVQGQAALAQISDPFGLGWNLFGTASFLPNVGVIRADTTWYLQVFFIVLGHIAAVYLAHVLALRIFPRQRQAVVSQIPMLILMVTYTLTGLWILSQPLSPGV